MILNRLSHDIPGGRAYRPLLAGARQFPGTSSAWSSAFPGITAPTALYTFQESALPVEDQIGTKDLVSGNASGDELVQQTGDPYGRYSVLLEDLASHLRSSTSDFDLDGSTSLSGMFRWKQAAGYTSGAGHYFMRKKSITAGSDGWATKFNNSSGHVNVIFDTPGAGETVATIALNHVDGNWHDFLFVVDRGTSQIRIYSDLGSASASISAHTTPTNTVFFGLGDTQGNLNSCAQGYYSYAAVWLGTVITQTQWDTIRGAA